jgi:Methane oxygenase PmoA
MGTEKDRTMIRTRPVLRSIALAWLAWSFQAPVLSAQVVAPADPVTLTVKAGEHDREHTPIRFELPEGRLGPALRKAVEDGPVVTCLARRGSNGFFPAEVHLEEPGPRLHVTFVLPKPLRAREEAQYELYPKLPLVLPPQRGFPVPWSFDESRPGAMDLKFGDRPVFRYNYAPVSSPNYKEIQNRDAYIHPAYSPSGALITGDFSPSHPHHRGFFLAYERTKTGDLSPDFWNIHVGTGKIHCEAASRPFDGPVTARFSADHRWEAKDKATGKGTVVLRERWDVEAYAIPNAPYWLFDIISTQQAVDRPLGILPYRYGGMAYRGPEPFVKGTLDVLTSEGKHRKDGDQKPARWVDLTGPIADGSDKYAGAMIADHPSNPHYPNVVRIHPTTLPFFSYVPAYDKPLTIAVDTPTVFRYRVLIHDGHPDPVLDDRVARDFAEPPVVVVE